MSAHSSVVGLLIKISLVCLLLLSFVAVEGENEPYVKIAQTNTTSSFNSLEKNPTDASIVAVGNDGTIIKLDKDGISKLPKETNSNLNNIDWKPDGTYAIIVGDNGSVMKYEEGRLDLIDANTDAKLNDVAWNPNGESAVIVGDEGRILVYNGNELSYISSGTNEKLKKVSWINETHAVIIGENGAVLEYVQKKKPKIGIIMPSENELIETIDGKINVVGWVKNAEKVEIKINNEAWVKLDVEDNNFWEYSFKSNNEGENKLYARAYNGYEYSNLCEVKFKVVFREGDKSDVIAPSNDWEENKVPSLGNEIGIEFCVPLIILIFLLISNESFRLKCLWFLLPLYTRMRKEVALDQYNRGRIYTYIKSNPGAHYSRIKKELNLKNGTLVYHLAFLEKMDIIKSCRDGFYRRYYSFDDKITNGRLTEIQEEIIKALKENPRALQKDIALKLGISRRVVSYHMKKLREVYSSQ
ncbi:MAG: winged helix-turn-helix transcriptional regulator [Candidatus Thermoplasmatota archaeon]